MMHTPALSLLSACAGVLLALMLRRPLRRLAGPRPAFTLWLLPPLLAIMPWLPAWPTTASGFPAFSVLPALPAIPALPAANTSATHPTLLAWSWLAGCAWMLGRLAWHYLRIVRAANPMPDAMARHVDSSSLHGFDGIRISLHPAGPAVLWGPRCRMLLPADFLERFDPEARIQVLAHERMHLRRHDPLWSLLAELMLAALWFFPPAWWALSRFRLDQELACDAAVLHEAPEHAAAYARALLTSNDASIFPAPMAPWFSTPQLKERLTMIRHRHASLLRRHSGYAALAVLLAGTALAAHATLPAAAGDPRNASATTPAAALAFADRTPPRYPLDAIKHHEQGTIVLNVLVDTQGKAEKVTYDPERSTSDFQSLIQAATAAAKSWTFTPAAKNGEPVEQWARIPVKFALPKYNAAQKQAAPAIRWHPAASPASPNN